MPIDRKPVVILGMELEQWNHEGCVANFATGADWATLYDICTPRELRRQGLATTLLTEAKAHYEARGKQFGSTIALTPGMARILLRLGIKEHGEE